jgi:hypothetical protein
MSVLSIIRTPRVLAPSKVQGIEEKLETALNGDVDLYIRCVLTRDVASTGAADLLVRQNLDGSIVRAETHPDVRIVEMAEQVVREYLARATRAAIDDVRMLRLSTGPVIIAEVRTVGPPVPEQVERAERTLRDYTGEPDLRLLVRTVEAIDMTSKGRVLLGRAHFEEDMEEAAQDESLERSVREAIEGLGDVFVTDIDAVDVGERWKVRTEVVGARVLSPRDVRRIEEALAKSAGKPVDILALSRTEVAVTKELRRHSSVGSSNSRKS